MASRCPKCRRLVSDDAICCAGLTQSWKCERCGKRSVGFVMPYGRCFMCGGELAQVEGYGQAAPANAEVIAEAVRFELEMKLFYELSLSQSENPQLRAVFAEMAEKERDHIGELSEKYHLDLTAQTAPQAAAPLSAWLFADIDFHDGGGHVLQAYERAIELEQRTADHFLRRAAELPPGPEQALFRELAAEEAEHVAILESERAQFAD